MFDGDNSMYLGDDSSYKKKEAELPKKLVSSLWVYLYHASKYLILTLTTYLLRVGLFIATTKNYDTVRVDDKW